MLVLVLNICLEEIPVRRSKHKHKALLVNEVRYKMLLNLKAFERVYDRGLNLRFDIMVKRDGV